jgi:hypothetical protein
MADDKPELSQLSRTILEHGLIDESMARMMEHWGTLPEGASQYVDNKPLVDATRGALTAFVDELEGAVEHHRLMRETSLDLDRLRWPVVVGIYKPPAKGELFNSIVASNITGVIDRMGRLYFRPDDVDEKWFAVGNLIERQVHWGIQTDTIVEVQALYIGEAKAAIQVSTLAR